MNTAHLHLMVNHLPVIATPLVAVLLVWGLWRRSREVIRVAVGAAVIIAAASYPVFLTGEPAEDQLEDASWIKERMVHEHEERAEVALIAMLITGALAAVGVWQSRGGREVPRRTAGITLAGLALSAGLFGWTALAGGRIRHDEIRSTATASAPTADDRQLGSEGHRDRDADD
jgi:hypothetical protein